MISSRKSQKNEITIKNGLEQMLPSPSLAHNLNTGNRINDILLNKWQIGYRQTLFMIASR